MTAAALLLVVAIFAPGATLARPAHVRVFAVATPETDHPVTKAARRLGLPPRRARVVIAVESACDLRAFSRVGAMGLMQVIPATLAELSVTRGVDDDPLRAPPNMKAQGRG